MLLPGIGADGQLRVGESHVAIVGVGALGTVCAELLTRAGIGRLTLIDRDIVELTNLQRQTLFVEADAREHKPKALAAAERLGKINSGVRIFAEVADFEPGNAESLLGVEADRPACVIDCTDNFSARYLINDVCVKHSVPLVYCGAVGTLSTHMVVRPGVTPCLRCLWGEEPGAGDTPTCDTVGVLGMNTSLIASLAAASALKLALGAIDRLTPRITQVDLWRERFSQIPMGERDVTCVCCGQRRFEFLDGSRGSQGARTLCGRNSVQLTPARASALEIDSLGERLARHGAITLGPAHVHVTLAQHDQAGLSLTVFADGRAIVSGTSDPVRAKNLYAQLVGG